MSLSSFLSKISQLESLVLLVEKFSPFTGQKLSKEQWINIWKIDSDKALELLNEQTATVLVALVTAFPTREELRGEKGDSIQGDKGANGPSVGDVVQALKGELLKLAGQIQVPEERLQQIKSDLHSELSTLVSKIKPTVTEKVTVEKPTVIEKTEVIYQKVEFDFVAQLIENKLSIKNALDLIEDEEDKLSITAVAGLPKELAELRKLIQNIKIDRVDYWGGGLDEGEVVVIVNKILNALPDSDITWDFYVTNWSSEPTFIENITGGAVYSYTLNGVTRYRFVPDPYDPTEDIFYSTYLSPDLSGIIVARG